MKLVYWRPLGVSRWVLVLLAALSLLGLFAVEHFQQRQQQPFFEEKLAAARVARAAMEEIRRVRLERGPAIDPESDPARSGLVGLPMSAITTNVGHLPAKRTTINPNFAAVAVHLLKQAGVEEGDVIAVGVSGSFPAVNIAVLAAAQTLKLRPLVISSVAGSQWGANHPELTWLDMERLLVDRHLVSTRSIAASPGGVEDRALGLPPEGRALVDAAIARSGVPPLLPRSYAESVQSRWDLYRRHAHGQPITAYVNVGGGTASVGTRLGKKLFEPGLNRVAPPGATSLDSIMVRFVRDGVPVIHFVNMAGFAERYGLPRSPHSLPRVGEGKVYVREQYNAVLAWGVLLAILACLYVFVRTDFSFTHPGPEPRPDDPGRG